MAPPANIDSESRQAAETRQNQLTKPPGALGLLESVAITLAGMQGREKPEINRVEIRVFAGDHGVVEEGVSAFPQQVTYEMVKNFSNGGAAINVLAREMSANLEVVNLGTVVEAGDLSGVTNHILGAGTSNFTKQPAMTNQQFEAAMTVGQLTALESVKNNADLFIGGEMGIGNTTSAAAVSCVLLGIAPALMAGPGTGLDNAGVSHKAQVIERAIQHHQSQMNSPIEVLKILGGFEIAALTGAYIACAQQGIPVLVDGFISTCAALCASRICVGSNDWFLYSHTSAEPGHQSILSSLNAEPLLDLGMRLGEGSGAAATVPMLRLACALHSGMATFAEAGVSEG